MKQFESSRKKLYTLYNKAHKNSPYVKEVTSAQIGYYRDFYTINNVNSLGRLGLTDKDAIEKQYNARVENRFEKLVAQLLSPLQMLSLEDAEEILMMLLSFKQRNPVFRQAFEDPKTILEAFDRQFDEVFEHRSTFEEILKREGRMNFDEFVQYGRDYLQRVAHDPNTPKDIHTEGIVKLHQQEDTAAQEVANALLGCEWFIFETTPQRPFITSDNPGFCIDNNEQIHNLNFADAAGFIFPLTPSRILLITAHFADQVGSVKKVNYRLAKPDLVELINRGTFMVSYKKTVSNDANTLRYVWRDMCRFMPHLKDAPKFTRQA
ncbi:hypothetical protein GCM10027185_61060 [Spirosoma pulveris]